MMMLFALICLQNDAYARVILDKQHVYIEVNGKADFKFGYAFNESGFRDKPKDTLSNYSNLRLLYLQRVYQNTQMGFNVKGGISI